MTLHNQPDLDGLDVLMQRFATLQAGIGGITVISGDAFAGKSYLVQKWQQNLRHQHQLRNVTWVEMTAARDSQAFMTNALLSLLEHLPKPKSQVSPTPSSPLSLEQLLDYIEMQLSNTKGRKDNQKPAKHSRSAKQTRLITIFTELLDTLVAQQPLILLIEDLHELDATSAQLLAEISKISHSRPILFILVLRYEPASPAWKTLNELGSQNPGHFVHIQRENLGKPETRQLVVDFLEAKNEPEQLVNQVYALTNGNPGFTIDILHTLVEDGIIKRSGKHWLIPQEVSHIPIPASIRSYFETLFFSLPEVSQKILQAAAIIGVEFPRTVILEMLTQLDITSSGQALLSRLETQEIITIIQVTPEVFYRFKQPLLREIILPSIDQAFRKQLYALTAALFTKNYPDQLDTIASQLADYYYIADDDENAGLYYTKAAQSALEKHAYSLAEINFRKALSVCKKPENHAALFSGLGQTLAQQSLHADAIEAWKQAAENYLQSHEYTLLAEIYARMARSAWWMKDYPLCLLLCQEGLESTQSAPHSAQLALLTHETGRAYYFLNDMKSAQYYCEEALRMGKELGSEAVQAEVLATMGILPALSGRKAIAALQASIHMAESNDLKATASRAYVNLAAVMENMGEIRLSRSHRIKALRIGRQNIPVADEALMTISIINTDIWLGEFAEAKNHFSQLRLLTQQAGKLEGLELELIHLEAQIEQRMGNISRAIELFSLMAKTAESSQDAESVTRANYALAEILLESVFFEEGNIPAEKLETASSFIPRSTPPGEFQNLDYTQMSQVIVIKALQGDIDPALNLLERMRKGSDHQGGYAAAIVSLTEARVSSASSDLAPALKKYAQSLELFKKMEARWWLAHTHLEMAVLHILRNEPEDVETAQSLLRESLSGFNQMGCEYYPDVIIDKLRIVRQQFREQAITSRKNKRELDQAGKVQTSFIPANLPKIPGWQLAAALQPARETSGDFFDFILLPGGKTGVVIADVGDKGAGAALYMAMCRTLFRSYAPSYPNDPAEVLRAVNERILNDTKDGIFLTAVYAILDTENSEITYANAGHNPPCFVHNQPNVRSTDLQKTGPLVGIFKESIWMNQTIQLKAGDELILYTDGVTEAQDKSDAFYDYTRFCQLIEANRSVDASQLISSILTDVSQFTSGADISDDITLVIVRKDPAKA